MKCRCLRRLEHIERHTYQCPSMHNNHANQENLKSSGDALDHFGSSLVFFLMFSQPTNWTPTSCVWKIKIDRQTTAATTTTSSPRPQKTTNHKLVVSVVSVVGVVVVFFSFSRWALKQTPPRARTQQLRRTLFLTILQPPLRKFYSRAWCWDSLSLQTLRICRGRVFCQRVGEWHSFLWVCEKRVRDGGDEAIPSAPALAAIPS